MRFPLPFLIVIGAFLALPAAPGQEVVVRHTITIDGIAEVPKTYPIAAVGLRTEVVLIDDGSPILKKAPGLSTVEGVTFLLPEIDDEVLVFFDWWTRIATTGVAEPHAVDIIGYNGAGSPVARWYLENAWPSKVVGPPLRSDSNEFGVEPPAALGFAITLQADRIHLLPTDGTAPWPQIVDLATDPAANTFTMTWRSVADATYTVCRWDERSGTFVETATVTATGKRASHTRTMAEREILYVLLTSAPPPPSPE